MACEYISNCSYFVYDKIEKVCKLNTDVSTSIICDMIHGTPEPDFQQCIDAGKLVWASGSENSSNGEQTTNIAGNMLIWMLHAYTPDKL